MQEKQPQAVPKKSPLLHFDDLIVELKAACDDHRNGYLYIVTEDQQWAKFGLNEGTIVEIGFHGKLGAGAIPIIKQITHGKFFFVAHHKAAPMATAPLPSTSAILRLLGADSTGKAQKIAARLPPQDRGRHSNGRQPSSTPPVSAKKSVQPRAEIPKQSPGSPYGQRRTVAPGEDIALEDLALGKDAHQQAGSLKQAPPNTKPPDATLLVATSPRSKTAPPTGSIRPTQKPKIAADAKTILVVEDSTTTRKVIAKTLTHNGYAVREAKDGFTALAQMSEQIPDLVLLDIIMPGIDGHKVLTLIRKHKDFKEVPVIMLTSRDKLFDKLKGKVGGTNEYLTKPFNPSELLDKVRKYL